MALTTVDDMEPMGCDNCHGQLELSIVVADLGNGAFLRVLCATCWHRLQYRAHLLELRRRAVDERRKHGQL